MIGISKKINKEFERFLAFLRLKSSITDRLQFRNYCKIAAGDPKQFKTFRANDAVACIVGSSADYGIVSEYYENLKKKFLELDDLYDKLKANDVVGSPKTYEFADGRKYSVNTLRYLETAFSAKKIFGDLRESNVVEIGGGYGGQCKVLNDLGGFKSYTLIDLPEVLELAARYLGSLNVTKVCFQSGIRLDHDIKADLVISDFAFCELARFQQDYYFDRILRFAKCGYMNFNRFRFGKKGYRIEELAEKIKGAEVVDPGMPIVLNHKILIWGHCE